MLVNVQVFKQNYNFLYKVLDLKQFFVTLSTLKNICIYHNLFSSIFRFMNYYDYNFEFLA